MMRFTGNSPEGHQAARSLSESAALIRSLKGLPGENELSSAWSVIETHISWVLFNEQYAYKIKKPVKLNFLDFSTLERREFFCREELRLNRRLAPELYLDVVPITGTNHHPQFGGTGTPIEFAVKMASFSQEALLGRKLMQQRLSPRHIDELAQLVAEFHSKIEVVTEDASLGTPESIRQLLEETFQSIITRTNAGRRRAQIERLRAWCQREFDRRQDDFRDRKRHGFVRECHGDMHLGNMVLIDDSPVVFDGIEFNATFRWIDVMSEIAFVAMDLEDRGRPDLAHRFVNLYLELTGDYAGLNVLPFYLTYRALVRAKVDLIRLGQDDVRPDEENRLVREFGGYLDQAERHIDRPWLAITHGLSGSGKTSGTQPLIESHGAIRIRSDIERKRIRGLYDSCRGFRQTDEDIYTEQTNRDTYERLLDLAETILSAGFPVIVDATFLRWADRDCFRQMAIDRKVPFALLAFEADERTLRERIAHRIAEGRDASDANQHVLTSQLQKQEPLSNEEREAAIVIVEGLPISTDRLVKEFERR